MRLFTLALAGTLLARLSMAQSLPAFTTLPPFSFPGDAIRALTYDLNRDGTPDVLIAGGGFNQATLLLSTGPAAYAPAISYPTSGYCGGLGLGNANCDQYADLWLADFTAGAVLVLPGQAGGTFGPASSQAVAGQPQHVVTGDFNGDGRTDFAALDKLSSTLSVRLHEAAPSCANSYTPAQNYPTASGGLSAEFTRLYDLNSDGHLDAVVVNQASPNQKGLSLLLGDAAGGFGSKLLTYATGAGFPVDLTLSDLDGDGNAEAILALADDNNLAILPGRATEPYLGPRMSYPLPAQAAAVAVADFDLDGRPDVAAILATGQLVLLRGTAGGTLAPAIVVSTLPYQGKQLLTADFNRDGRPDLALISGGRMQMLLNQPPAPLAARSAASPPPLPYPNPSSTSTFELGEAGGRALHVCNALGQTVPATLQPDGRVQLSQPRPGVYLLDWQAASGQPRRAKVLVAE